MDDAGEIEVAFTIFEEGGLFGSKNLDYSKLNAKIGFPSNITTSGGGSDTNIFNANGIHAVNLGIGKRKPHTLEEHLHIKDLENAARLALEIIKIHVN